MGEKKVHDSRLLGIEGRLRLKGDYFGLGWEPAIITLEPLFNGSSGQKQIDLWVVGVNPLEQALFEYKCNPDGRSHYYQAQQQLFSCRDYLKALFDIDPVLYYVWGPQFEYQRV